MYCSIYKGWIDFGPLSVARLSVDDDYPRRRTCLRPKLKTSIMSGPPPHTVCLKGGHMTCLSNLLIHSNGSHMTCLSNLSTHITSPPFLIYQSTLTQQPIKLWLYKPTTHLGDHPKKEILSHTCGTTDSWWLMAHTPGTQGTGPSSSTNAKAATGEGALFAFRALQPSMHWLNSSCCKKSLLFRGRSWWSFWAQSARIAPVQRRSRASRCWKSPLRTKPHLASTTIWAGSG